MSIIAKECLVRYFDETGEYEEIELKENKEYIFKIKARFEETDDSKLLLSACDRFEIDVDDIRGIEEVRDDTKI